jgi:lysophospholipase L1-like esterase
MKTRMIFVIIAITLISAGCVNRMSPSDESGESVYDTRWGAEINAFKQRDENHPVPDNGILFVGSSSIRMWETDRFFPDLEVLNRGFGGSDIKAVNYFFDTLVSCYKPSTIVFYAGDNDIAGGLGPKGVCDDFKTFYRLCSDKLPETEIIYLSIKPSGARIGFWPEMQKANALIEQFCQTKPNLQYLDLASCLLDDAGKPNDDLFINDRLHLNEAGYRLWTERLTPLLVACEKSQP